MKIFEIVGFFSKFWFTRKILKTYNTAYHSKPVCMVILILIFESSRRERYSCNVEKKSQNIWIKLINKVSLDPCLHLNILSKSTLKVCPVPVPNLKSNILTSLYKLVGFKFISYFCLRPFAYSQYIQKLKIVWAK